MDRVIKREDGTEQDDGKGMMMIREEIIGQM
jgi:hypothetical protein